MALQSAIIEKGTLTWYWIATGNWSSYLELSSDEAERYRKSGASVIPVLPPDIVGVCACRYEEE